MDSMQVEDPAEYARTVAEFWRSMPQFFPASSACDTLLRERLVATRERARQLCVAMAQDGVFLRVGAAPSPFVDDQAKWRLTWTSAEETQNNVLLQRAVPVLPPPEALLAAPADAPHFDDALSIDSQNNWDRFHNDEDDDDHREAVDTEEEMESDIDIDIDIDIGRAPGKYSDVNAQDIRADPLALRTQLQLLQGKASNMNPRPQSTNTSDSYVGSYSPTRSGSGIRHRNGIANVNRHSFDANLEHHAYDGTEGNVGSDSSTRAVPVAVPSAAPKGKLSFRRDRPKLKPLDIPPVQDNSTIVIQSSPRVPRGVRLDDVPPRPIVNANIPNPAFPRPPSFGSMRSVPMGVSSSTSNAAHTRPKSRHIPLNPLQSPASGKMHSVPRGINLESESFPTNTVDHRRLARGINLDTKNLSSGNGNGNGNSRGSSDAYNGYTSSSVAPGNHTTTRTSFELHANVFDFPMSPPRSPSVDTVHCVPKLPLVRIPLEKSNIGIIPPPPPKRATLPPTSMGIDRRNVDRDRENGATSIGSGNGSRSGSGSILAKVEVVPRNNRFSFDKYQAQSQHNSLSSWERQKFVRNSSFDALDNRKFTRNSSFDAMQAKRNAMENSNNTNSNSNNSIGKYQYPTTPDHSHSRQIKAHKSSSPGIPGTFEAAAPIAEISLTSGIEGSPKINTPLHVLAKQARGLGSSHANAERERKQSLLADVDSRSNLGYDDTNDEKEDEMHGELEKGVALPVQELKGDDRKLPSPPKVIVEDVVKGPLDDTMEFELSPFGQDTAFDGPPAGRGHIPAAGGGRRKERKGKNIPAMDQPSVEKRAKMLGKERHLSEKRLGGLGNSNYSNYSKYSNSNITPIASPRRGPPSPTSTATGDTLPHESDVALPNVGMIREKLKRAFQAPTAAVASPPSSPQHQHLAAGGQIPLETMGKQDGKQGNHGGLPPLVPNNRGNSNMNYNNGNGNGNSMKGTGEPKDGVSELSSVPARERSSLPAEVSPVTTPRKPWRILRALSGRPGRPVHGVHGVHGGGNDDASSTFTDSEGDGNETSNTTNTIATNTTGNVSNGNSNSIRTSKTHSLRDRVLNSLRRSTRRAGRDAFADRLEGQMYDGNGNGNGNSGNGNGNGNGNHIPSSPHWQNSQHSSGGQQQYMWRSGR